VDEDFLTRRLLEKAKRRGLIGASASGVASWMMLHQDGSMHVCWRASRRSI